MSPFKKWAASKKVTPSSANLAAEQCLDSIKEYFECTICRDHLDRPIQTKCGHVFCSKCLQDLSKEPNATCPLCKVKITNRSLIVREDVDDMKNIVARLSEAFTSELEKYFDWKVTPRKKTSSTGTSSKKVEDAPKAGSSSKTTLVEPTTVKDKAGTESGSVSHLDEVEVEDKRETTGKNKRFKGSRKSTEGRTSVDNDEQELHISNDEIGSPAFKQNPTIDSAVESGDTRAEKSPDVISDTQSNETSVIKSKEAVGISSGGTKGISSKDLSRDAMLEKMRKQTYVIMDSGIETIPAKNKSQSPGKALDLSLSRRRSAQFTEYVYAEKPTTIRYIKPLDLSMKKEKRKFENDNITTNVSMTSNKTIQPVVHSSKLDCYIAPPQSPQRKRGKFEDNFVGSHEKEPQASTLKQSSATTKRAPVTMDYEYEVDFETCPEDDEVAHDDGNVFTPTPPPVINVYVSKKKEANQNQKINSAKKAVRPSQFNIESQVMKDFDLPFEDDEMGMENPSSGGKVTSSDELLCNITEESVMRGAKARSQPKLGQSQAFAKTSKEKEQFVFKQPSGSIPQVSKKKPKDGQNKKDDVFMECDDDEFQQPRDSDLMFLDLTLDGSGAGKEGGDRGNKPNSNELSPSSEKENSVKRSSLSRSGSRRATPVKSTPSTVNEKTTKALSLTIEDTDLKKSQMLKPSNDPVEAFEDDDEDWLLDIPMEGESRSSGKRMSGKSKRSEEDKITEVSEIAPSVIVPLKSQKQRYVFCPTRLSKQQTLKLQQLCTMCDGVITKDFTPEVTHLIINLVAGRVPQTLKYLLAIAGRKWVVIYDWVEQCVNAGELVSEDQFETSNYKQCDPGVRRSRLAKRKLFDGFKFYFATEHYKTMGFTREEVSKLIETLGGTVVESPKDMYRDLIIIGSKNGNSTDYNHWLNTNKWATVTFEWVIGCILEYRLKQFDSNFLCIDVTDVKSINAPKTFQTAFSQYMTQVTQAMSPA